MPDDAPHVLALPPGYVLETYRIERVLGEGGFGITYLAVDAGSGKKVAIKELLPGDISTRIQGSTVVPKGGHLAEAFAWALDCFANEARALAHLSHPNVVPIHRLFQANGTAYMVMDYVEGDSLRQWLEKHPRPTEEELRAILLPLLDGLEHVHEHGLLHRDIKPDNIFLTAKGRPVLLDFGSARVDTGRTQTMTAVVSEGYSPYEQYQRKARQTAATDFYSLAAVMVRAITGATPTTAIDRAVDASLQKPVSQTHAGRFSVEFLRAVDAAFSVNATERPQSVAQWREMLLGGRESNRSEGMERGVRFAASQQSVSSSKFSSSVAQGSSRAGSGLNSTLRASPSRSWLPWAAAGLVTVGIGAAVFVLLGEGGTEPGKEPAADSPASASPGAPTPQSQPPAAALPPQSQPAPPAPAPKRMPVVVTPAPVMPPMQKPSPPVDGGAPSSATKDAPFVNTLGMKFVPVPGTQVLFCMHETRNADYAACAQASTGVNAEWKKEAGSGTNEHPVVDVSWEDAKAFCAWLSRKEGKTYRLPTDHEWSVAVGIGDLERESDGPLSKSEKIAGVYPWGGGYPPTARDGNYGKHTGVDDGYSSLAPVMHFKPNQLGLYDLGGNVWELCEDSTSSGSKFRVSRGGSSYSHAVTGDVFNLDQMLSSCRVMNLPASRIFHTGFRCVLELDSAPQSALPSSASSATRQPASDALATFSKKDTNLDGRLAMDEFIRGTKDAAKSEMTFKRKDNNADGYLSPEEFFVGTKKKAAK